jgi:hypothetical protein
LKYSPVSTKDREPVISAEIQRKLFTKPDEKTLFSQPSQSQKGPRIEKSKYCTHLSEVSTSQ